MSTSEFYLCRLIYFSSASPNLTERDLDDILQESISGNSRCNITGILAYDDFHFMQILEGGEKAVNDLYLCIAADARHHNVRLLNFQQIENRRFDDWSMALAKLPEVTGRYIDRLYGGFKPQLFSITDALKYFDLLREYLHRAA